MPRYFQHTVPGYFANGGYAEWLDGAAYVAYVFPGGRREEERLGHAVQSYLDHGLWREIPPPIRRFRHADIPPPIRRFRHADRPDQPFNDGTDYVELPVNASEGYCVLQDGRHSARHSTKWILECVKSGDWVEIPVVQPAYILPQETTVTRYFHHKDGFANDITHAELINGHLDAVRGDGSRDEYWWPAGNLEGFLRRGEWVEFFPDAQHDLFIDQASADTEHNLTQLERNARFEAWTFRRHKAHGRLMEKCFTDTRRHRWDLRYPRGWPDRKRNCRAYGREVAPLIAQLKKNPSLHALHGLWERWDGCRRFKSEAINNLLQCYQRGERNFACDEWRNPVWCDESWYRDSEHYARQAHVSVKNPMNVAFHGSLDKLERDIQTTMKPGRFLQRYFSDVLSEQEIREWAHKWELSNKPPEVRFIENTDPRGWVDIYSRDSGFDSCMTGESCVRVYAHRDNSLRLAYMVNPADEDAVVARAIVVEKKKAYVRCYGDDRLIGALEALGYSYRDYALEDEVLAKIEHGDDSYLMPYLDAQCKKHTGSYSSMSVNDMGDEWRVSRHGKYDCGNTTGCITIEADYCCPNCGCSCGEDDLYYSEYHNVNFCGNCEDEFVLVHVSNDSDDWVRHESTIEVDGETWVNSPRVLHRAGFEECAECGEWHAADDMTGTSRGLVCSCTETVELAAPCPGGYDYACLDDTKRAIDATTGQTVFIHENTDYDESYADPEAETPCPPPGALARLYDDCTAELFGAAA